MAGGPPKGGEKDSEELLWIAAAICVFVICWLVWTYARGVVVWIAYGFDMLQFQILKLVLGFKPGGQWDIWHNYLLDHTVGGADPYEVTLFNLMAPSEMVGAWFRIPFAVLIAVLAVVVIFKMKGSGFSRNFSLAGGKMGPSLATYQAEHWRVIAPGAAFDPDKQDANEMPSRTPMEWMRDNGVRLTAREGLDVEGARKAFERQLGNPWPGLRDAPAHVQAVAVMCALNAKRDKNVRKIKEDITVIWATQKEKAPEMCRAYLKPFLEDKKLVEVIEKYASKHAYTTTALYRLLDWGRRLGGVFASAEFRWLKAVDRNLWYVLNNTGRRAFHVEGAGPVCHFQTELVVKRPMVEPHVEQALEGLEDYLEEQGVTDLDKFFTVEKDF